jgi:hypothetical protein
MKGVDDKPYALDQATLIRKIAEVEAERDELRAALLAADPERSNR